MGISSLKMKVPVAEAKVSPKDREEEEARQKKLQDLKKAKQLAVNLEAAQKELDDFQAEHEEIFERQIELMEAITVATNLVKDAARATDGFETKRLNVFVDHKTRRWTDVDLFLKKVPAAENFKGLIVKSIDAKILAALVKAEQIDAKIVKACERTEPMTSAVTIKPREAPKA